MEEKALRVRVCAGSLCVGVCVRAMDLCVFVAVYGKSFDGCKADSMIVTGHEACTGE